MFMLGCAGDANPYPRGTMELVRITAPALGEEVCRVLGSKLRPVSGPLQVAFDRADLPLETSLSRKTSKSLPPNKRDAKAYGGDPDAWPVDGVKSRRLTTSVRSLSGSLARI